MAESLPKTIVCLGNPGPEYSMTRHNVAWWFADRFANAFDLGRFRKQGASGIAEGEVGGCAVRVVKPLTYMNRSGRVVTGASEQAGFDLVSDLLIIVDETALEPGRSRLRPGGSAGGHNGLRSIEEALGTQEYARLRIGVGSPPPGAALVDWVLSAPGPEERARILDRIDVLLAGVEVWLNEGMEAAMNRCNN